MDGETVEKLNAFLQSKLSSEDHAMACALMDGGAGEAQDTEPPLPKNGMGADDERLQATDSFAAMFPAMARVRLDTSIQPAARAASYSAYGAKSFAASFPSLAKIKIL